MYVLSFVLFVFCSAALLHRTYALKAHDSASRFANRYFKATQITGSDFLFSVVNKFGGRNSSLVVFGLAVYSVAGSILLWGNFPVEGIFPLELTWVQTPFPQNSFGWEYKPRSSLCTHAFHHMDSIKRSWRSCPRRVNAGSKKTHTARTIHEDGMWLP